MYTTEQLREIYRRLAEPFPEEAVERTRSSETRRGYDTTGIKYQYVVNRLNEVLGVGGFRVQRDFSIREKQTRNGYPMIEATCDLVMQLGQWDGGQFVPFAEATGTGGHSAASEADAKKGAFTNGFKKVAAFFGCGWQAYAGVIDDDNVPAAEAPSSSAPTRQQEGYQPRQRRSTRGQSTPTSDSSSTDNGNGHNGSGSGSSNGNGSAEATGNGRVTTAQLGRMRELVGELGRNWADFREHVRQQHGINVEYADRQKASELIKSLVAATRKNRGNGTGARAT